MSNIFLPQAGAGSIPEYTSDPASPTAEFPWVLKGGGGGAGGGIYKSFVGFHYTTKGSGALTYQFSYPTLEATIKRTTLS